MTAPTGYIRERGGKLEAVIKIAGRKVRKGTGYEIGQEPDAQRFLATVLQELKSQAPAADEGSSQTFQAFGEKWLAERKARNLISAVDEEARLKLHAFPQLGETPLEDLTKAQMIEWARGLTAHVSPRTGRALSPRYVHHVAETVKRMLGEAADLDLIPVNPCVWKAKRDLPAKADRDPSKRRTGGFSPEEVAALLHDPRIPEERRVLYALEFLTGMRTGETAARRWRDLDATSQPLPRLEVRTAWNTRVRREKSTKTLVEKVVPVHPELSRILAAWRAEGWARYTGREPTADDLIVPTMAGRPRNASFSNRRFRADLQTLGLRDGDRRTHYETRATFRSLAIGGGAVRADLDLITHPSPRQASDLYTRMDQVWPALCRVVECICVPPWRGVAPSGGEVTGEVTEHRENDAEAASPKALAEVTDPRYTARLSGAAAAEGRWNRPVGPPEHGGTRQPGAPEAAGRDLPDALPAFLAAAANLAAQAAERGELAAARRLLDAARRALDGAAGPVLRVVAS